MKDPVLSERRRVAQSFHEMRCQVAYSGDSCHPIRCKAATSSEGSLPPNPDESCTPSVPSRSAATPGLIRLRYGHVGFHGRMTFTHRISSECNLVRVMEQAVKDRVRQGRISQGLMPMLHWELAGDHGRATAVAVFQEFKDIAAVLITEGGKSPVIKNEEGGFGQRGHEFRIPSIAFGNRELLEQARQPQVEDGVPFATGLVAQRTAEPGFPTARWARDEHIVPIVDPWTGGQAKQEGFIESTRVPIVDILQAGTQA